MLYAILICTDEGCADEFEGWGQPDEFDELLCETCGCTLQAVAFSEVRAEASVTRLPRFTPHVQFARGGVAPQRVSVRCSTIRPTSRETTIAT